MKMLNLVFTALASVLIFSSWVCAGTIYVRADGTAGSLASATGCESDETAIDVETHNASVYLPGDRVVFCDDGGVFRSVVWTSFGGTSDSPIIYDGRGTAVVSGSDVVGGWAHFSGDTYVAGHEERAVQLFVDGVFGDRKASRGKLSDDGDWFWESGQIFLLSENGDPDQVYTNPGVEVGARNAGIQVDTGQDHVIIDGFLARHANISGFWFWKPGSNTVVRNCVAEWNWHAGFDFDGDRLYSDLTIEDNTARYNGTGGIVFLGRGRNSRIQRNKCYENGKYQSFGNEFDPEHQWTFGIKLWENGSNQEGIEVHHNECFRNGRGQPGDYQGRGVGIWIDGLPGNPDNLTVVRHNLVYDNTGNGIFIEISSNTATFGNVLINNASNTGGVEEFTPANIAVDARVSWTTENNLIFNNTSVGGRYGIKVATYAQQGCWVRNNSFINNIVVSASEHNLYGNFGGDNDGIHGSGNVYRSNSFGVESVGFIRWGGDEYDTYADWETAYGGSSDSIEEDPALASPESGRVNLRSFSPCRNAGVDLGPEYAQGLLANSVWPDQVNEDEQNILGRGWDLGAYLYTVLIRRESPSRRLLPNDPFIRTHPK